MALCNITGTLKDSGGFVLSGQLWVQLDGAIVDTDSAPDTTYIPKVYKFTITNGVINISLAQSEVLQTTYWFRFYANNADNTTGIDDTPSIDFHAFVPNLASAEFSDLVPTGVTKDTLDTAIARLARILVSTQDYAEALRGGPRPKGAYSAATYYQRGDAVSYAGSWWWFASLTPKANSTPSVVNTDWIQVALKGDAGGTGGNDVPYDATGWDGATWAPSANAIRDKIEQLATIASLAAYAPLASPTLTGSPNRSSNPLAGDRSTQLATTQWAGNEFAPINNAALTGNPTAPTPPQGIYNTQLATLAWVRSFVTSCAFVAYKTSDQALSTGNVTIAPFSTKPLDTDSAFNSTTGAFTVPTGGDGWYEFYATARFSRSGGTQIDFLSLSVYAGGNDYRVGEIQATAMTSVTLSGPIRIYLTAGQTAILRVANNQVTGTITCQNNFSNSFFTHFSGRKLPY